MQVIPFLCVFILDGALFGDDVKKFMSDLIIYILYVRRGGFLGGALEWLPQRSYIIVMPCLW